MTERDDGRSAHWQGRAAAHLRALCAGRDRRPGGADNQASTAYAAEVFARSGWSVVRQEFAVTGWEGGDGTLTVPGSAFRVHTSPYSPGVEAAGRLVVARTLEELRSRVIAGAIILLVPPLTARPLTPKAFPFYRVEEDQRLIDFLEAADPAVIVAATGSCPEAAGALRPFPFIEDGDFSVPSAYVDEQAGAALATLDGAPASIRLDGRRQPSLADNVIARRGEPRGRVTLVAHIDTKVGTPGALDNAAGVTVLLLLAEMLGGPLPVGVELLVVNGEDYYNAAGEVAYLRNHGQQLGDLALAINLDGVGYREGRTAYSLYGCDDALSAFLKGVLDRHGLVAGPQWWQGDHALFAMAGRPAVALTSERLDIVVHDLAHTARDTVEQVDARLLVQAGEALREVIGRFPAAGAERVG